MGQVRVIKGEDVLYLGSEARRLDEHFQLFRGTTVLVSPTDSSQPYVEGVALRIGGGSQTVLPLPGRRPAHPARCTRS